MENIALSEPIPLNFWTAQVLLSVVCVLQLISAEHVEYAKTKWTYKDEWSENNNNNSRSLPDSIQIVLELDSGKVTLNLIRRPTLSTKLPLVVTQLEGQRSVWNPSGDEPMGIYRDPSTDASATVVIREVNRIKEVLYMVTFTHEKNSFSLEPIFKEDPSSDKLEVQGRNKNVHNNNIHNNSKVLINIDGRLHSIVEMPTTKSTLKVQLDKEKLNGMKKEMTLVKRSLPIPSEKRQMTIEIFVIIDYSIFKEFLERSKAESDSEKNEDALKNILYTFTHIMEGVKNDYERIEMEGLRFTTQLVGLMVAQSSPDVPFIEDDKVKIDPYTVDANAALDKLQEWQTHQSKENGEFNFPHFDFLVALTSYNLLIVNELKSKHIAGIVSSTNICKQTIVSIVKKMDFFATRSTISHEIGHSLGMSHDIDEENCKPGDNFIMTPSFVHYSEEVLQNSYQFSPCSLSHLKTKIDELDSYGGNCLTDEGLDFNRGYEKVTVLGLYPGQLYDLDDQCRMVYGPESLYCGGLLSDQEMCKTISCYSQSECTTEPLLKAMDGTSCSKGSWCLKGKCVPDDRAPRAPKNCTNGDFLLPMKHGITCEKVNRAPYLCSLQLCKDQCCATCVNDRSSKGGCEDAIQECSNLKPRDCYNKFYATTCCKTCKTLVQDSSDSNCLYGDKGVGCSGMLPEVCHLNSRYCCQTCAKYSAAKNLAEAT